MEREKFLDIYLMAQVDPDFNLENNAKQGSPSIHNKTSRSGHIVHIKGSITLLV